MTTAEDETETETEPESTETSQILTLTHDRYNSEAGTIASPHARIWHLDEEGQSLTDFDVEEAPDDTTKDEPMVDKEALLDFKRSDAGETATPTEQHDKPTLSSENIIEASKAAAHLAFHDIFTKIQSQHTLATEKVLLELQNKNAELVRAVEGSGAFEKEAGEWKERTSELEKEAISLRKEASEERDKAAESEREVVKCSEIANAWVAEANKWKTECEAKATKNLSLSADVFRANAKSWDLERKIESSQQVWKEKSEELEGKIASADAALGISKDAGDKEIARLSAAVEKANKQMDDTRAELKRREGAYQVLLRERTEETEAVKKSRIELESKQAGLNRQYSSATEQCAKLKDLVSEFGDLRGTVEERDTKIAQLEKELLSRSDQKTASDFHVALLWDRFAAKNKEIKILRARNNNAGPTTTTPTTSPTPQHRTLFIPQVGAFRPSATQASDFASNPPTTVPQTAYPANYPRPHSMINTLPVDSGYQTNTLALTNTPHPVAHSATKYQQQLNIHPETFIYVVPSNAPLGYDQHQQDPRMVSTSIVQTESC
jgi:hypothetical protein